MNDTPFCPLLLQARASMVDTTFSSDNAESGAPLYPIPTMAPGISCVGSRCAAWAPARRLEWPSHNRKEGRCGMTHYVEGDTWSRTFTDPASAS